MLTDKQLTILRYIFKNAPLNVSKNAWTIESILGAIFSEYLFKGREHGMNLLDYLFVKPGLLSISPDGRWCKLTEYGRAEYDETEAKQHEWEELPIIPVSEAEKEQIIIKPGEEFRGKFFVTQLLRRARSIVRLHDNFCANELLAWLYDVPPSSAIHILTSPRGVKQDRAFESLYRALKHERASAEVRLTQDLHDRKIIIDNTEAFQVGESIKDIGKKGTTIIRLKSVSQHIKQFDAIWNAAKPL